MKPLYTAHAHTTGGRDGRATAADGHPDLLLKPPKEMGGPDDHEATNPEELFALGYGACFLSALSFVARRQKISAKAFTIDSAVTLEQDDDGAFGLAVELHGTLPGVEDDRAAELMRAAHGACPYSRATRGNIGVRLFVGSREVSSVAAA
jgi:osmotically inducible protein OsmC